jgi:hypothetical protein
MQTYQATQEFWHRGVRIKPGDRISLSEREARYAVLNGDLTAVESAIESADDAAGKPAADPRKRGR